MYCRLAVIERKDLRKKLEEKMATLSKDLQESSVQEVEACREMSEAAAAIQTAEATQEAQEAVKVLQDQVDSMKQSVIDKVINTRYMLLVCYCCCCCRCCSTLVTDATI